MNKGKGKGSLAAAYNPYMHSSNLVLNDQFSGAYDRPNLVTVECEVPVSELTSGYRAQYAKDSVGWHAWHTGTVAGALRRKTGIERQVLLSRWIKPVRIVPDSEVAQMYKDLLDGTGISVPDNVVSPSLLAELKKAGVDIAVSGRVPDDVKYQARWNEDIDSFDDNNYNTDGMRWVYEEYALSKRERATLQEALADITYRGYKAFARTSDNQYIIPVERALVFTNGKYKNPTLSAVIRLNVSDPADTLAKIEEDFKHGSERNENFNADEAWEIVESLLRDGKAEIFSRRIRAKDLWVEHRRSGEGGRETDGSFEEWRGSYPVDDESFQLRDPDQISDRELLANVMDSAAETAAELDFVRRYRSKIDELNRSNSERSAGRMASMLLQFYNTNWGCEPKRRQGKPKQVNLLFP